MIQDYKLNVASTWSSLSDEEIAGVWVRMDEALFKNHVDEDL